MRVVKITKSGSSFKKNHYLVFLELDWNVTDDEIEHEVTDWANQDMSGHNNGYSLKWEDVTDKDEIKSALKSEIKIYESRIKRYRDRKNDLAKQLKILKCHE